MSKKEKLIWVVSIVACLTIMFLLFWNTNLFSENTEKQFNKKIVKQVGKQQPLIKNDNYKFYFHPRVRSWVWSQYKNFWEQPKLLKVVNTNQWTVGNYLDYFWPNWQKYYLISEKTLQRPVRKSNVVWYEHKEIIKKRKFRKEVDHQSLIDLGISSKNFRTTSLTVSKLSNLINDDQISWKVISNFVDQNFTKKEVPKLKKILRSNLWSFEWTDFYHESS